jgi:hypothetical protein
MGGTYCGKAEDYREIWWGNSRETDCLVEPGVNGRIILRWNFNECGLAVCILSSWIRIGTGGG